MMILLLCGERTTKNFLHRSPRFFKFISVRDPYIEVAPLEIYARVKYIMFVVIENYLATIIKVGIFSLLRA